jgi:hypothetical protein
MQRLYYLSKLLYSKTGTSVAPRRAFVGKGVLKSLGSPAVLTDTIIGANLNTRRTL